MWMLCHDMKHMCKLRPTCTRERTLWRPHRRFNGCCSHILFGFQDPNYFGQKAIQINVATRPFDDHLEQLHCPQKHTPLPMCQCCLWLPEIWMYVVNLADRQSHALFHFVTEETKHTPEDVKSAACEMHTCGNSLTTNV